MLTSNPNKWNSTLMSENSGGTTPTYAIYTTVGGQLPNPNVNECNSTLASGSGEEVH